MKKILSLFLVIFVVASAHAQYGISDYRDSLGWYRFSDKGVSYNIEQVISSKVDLGLTSSDSLRLDADEVDAILTITSDTSNFIRTTKWRIPC